LRAKVTESSDNRTVCLIEHLATINKIIQLRQGRRAKLKPEQGESKMDEIINTIAEQNHNPVLREDIIADIWNSSLGAAFEDIEDISKAISEDSMPAVTAKVRQYLGLPVIQ
jgi:hypothetical protein